MNGTREKTVIRTSVISIMANIVLTGFKATVGVLSHSIAIVTDAVNNLTDALSSIITIIGTHLAGREADREHPYGHGRVEYMTSMLVSAIVLYAGAAALVEAVRKMITPEIPDYRQETLAVLVGAIFIKFFLSRYVRRQGEQAGSEALIASGIDAFNDAILSISVLASTLIYIFFSLNLEPYVGAVLGLMIIRTGIDMIRKSASEIVGETADSTLSRKIRLDIMKETEVLGVFDLILNNYGPDHYQGSVHIELPSDMTVGEVDRLSRRISAMIKEKYGVDLHTVGVYSMDVNDRQVMKIRAKLEKLVYEHDGVVQLHGFYLDREGHNLEADIIISEDVKDRHALYNHIVSDIRQQFPDYNVVITLDLDMDEG